MDGNRSRVKDRSGRNGAPLTVARLAAHRRLPAAFLASLGLHDLRQGGVGIPYYGPSGEDIEIKRRTHLSAKEGSYWPKGRPLAAYGLWKLGEAGRAGFLILVEGESDTWTLWHHGLPGLGLPGANTVKSTLAKEHLDGIGKLYVCREPDRGGAQFVAGVVSRLGELDFTGRAFEVRMPDGIKDLSDLHIEDADAFCGRLQESIEASTPLTGAIASGVDEPPHWEEVLPLGGDDVTPEFPTELLPDGLRAWVEAEAQALQVPADLPACLTLAIAGAGLAGKIRAGPRQGWTEPLNLFTVVSLPPGERKSRVFADALAPVQEAEGRAQEDMQATIAEKASEHRVLENKLKVLEAKAAKGEDPTEAAGYKQEAKQLARELAAHQVPDPPQYYCDDVTPEMLGKLLARQGGRMLQASAEGTAFEIVKGRYSETANFDVYLKGHAGDPLRNDRISREQDNADQPALSVALAVQPDVLESLAEQPSLRGRGFLARFLYSIPQSRVGHRAIAPPPVPPLVTKGYRQLMTQLWELSGGTDAAGRPAPQWLFYAPEADAALRAFERWLEPQLARGEELSYLSDWAAKLAGAIVRISGVFHVVSALAEGRPWQTAIGLETVESAIRLGRDYMLPHALAAFGQMGADPRTELARQILDGLARTCECYESNKCAPPTVSRREIHQRHRTRTRFKTVEELEPVLSLLTQLGWLAPVVTRRNTGGRRFGPSYWINPAIQTYRARKSAPCTHYSHNTHKSAEDEPGDAWEGAE
jgi:hypothetical protein